MKAWCIGTTMALGLVIGWGAHLVLAQATAIAPKAAPVLAAAKEYPTFGVAISPVQGWDRLQGKDPEIIAQWTLIDEKAVNMEGEIAATIEPAAGRKLDDFAKTMAEEMSMKLQADKTQLGGQAALVLQGNPGEKLFHPARAILCQRGDYFYELISYGTTANDWQAELDAMAAAWKWIDFQPAEKYLAPLDQSVHLFDDLLIFKAPSLIRGYQVSQPAEQAYLGIYDYLFNRPIFTVDMQRMAKEPTVRPEEMQQDFARQLDAKLNRAKPLSWVTMPGTMPIYLSEPYDVSPTPQKAAAKDAKAKPAVTLPAPVGKMTVRSCLAFPTANDAIVISFGIGTQEPSAQQAYGKLVEEVTATFTSKPLSPAPPKPGK